MSTVLGDDGRTQIEINLLLFPSNHLTSKIVLVDLRATRPAISVMCCCYVGSSSIKRIWELLGRLRKLTKHVNPLLLSVANIRSIWWWGWYSWSNHKLLMQFWKSVKWFPDVEKRVTKTLLDSKWFVNILREFQLAHSVASREVPLGFPLNSDTNHIRAWRRREKWKSDLRLCHFARQLSMPDGYLPRG